jgi:hypothetical protein
MDKTLCTVILIAGCLLALTGCTATNSGIGVSKAQDNRPTVSTSGDSGGGGSGGGGY